MGYSHKEIPYIYMKNPVTLPYKVKRLANVYRGGARGGGLMGILHRDESFEVSCARKC